MEVSEAVTRLRSLANEMRLASVTLRALPDQLKETSRAIGWEVGQLLFRHAKSTYGMTKEERAADPSISRWGRILSVLRKRYKVGSDRRDGDAYISRRIFRGGACGELVGVRNVVEADMTEKSRSRFYFEQARDWARFIELAASQLHETPIEPEKPIEVKFIEAYNSLFDIKPQKKALAQAACR